MSNSPSGLSAKHQKEARELVLLCVKRLMEDPSQVHYTQGPHRWDGINARKGITKPGFLPFYGDCSATVTWILWRSLHVGFGVRDLVNGQDWKAGYTGTEASHGVRVEFSEMKVGDLVLYGQGPTYEHVAIYIGNGKVFSHGSEGGPYVLPWNYRPDVGVARRYI